MNKELSNSPLEYMLLALIPYSRPNLKLVFLPREFFKDLEKISKLKNSVYRTAYYHALKKGLIELDPEGVPRLTNAGNRKIIKFKAKRLGNNARLMVIFDIPEAERQKRQRLRLILREFMFKQVQRSVWVSEYDFKAVLLTEIKEMQLESYLQIFEAARIYPK